MTISPRTGRVSAQRRFDYRRLVSVFDTYVSTGRVDLSCRKRGSGGAHPESCEFTALAAAWVVNMDGRDLARATRDAYGRVSRAYLGIAAFATVDMMREAVNAATPAINSPPTQRLTQDKLQALYSLR